MAEGGVEDIRSFPVQCEQIKMLKTVDYNVFSSTLVVVVVVTSLRYNYSRLRCGRTFSGSHLIIS